MVSGMRTVSLSGFEAVFFSSGNEAGRQAVHSNISIKRIFIAVEFVIVMGADFREPGFIGFSFCFQSLLLEA
jgi:hypothetical protein